MPLRITPALLALGLAAASLIGAWVFQYGLGYAPCKLCLLQRWPYYIGLVLGAGGLITYGLGHDRTAMAFWALFALTFLVGAGLGIYHAGVEWKYWAGPTDCGGAFNAMPKQVTDLRAALATTKVVRCDEAPLRILGLSFAGWNVVVSLVVAGLAGRAAMGGTGRYGSSSLSQ